MKKLIAIVLALVFTLSMSIYAFAETAGTVDADGGTKNIDVKAKYSDTTQVPTVYHVDLTWGAMEFTYTISGTKVWNPENHQYTVSSTSDTWQASGNEMTVTNHSNIGIKAEFTYEKETNFDDVNGVFSAASLTFPSAEGKAVNDSVLTGKTTLTLSGTLANDQTTLTKVGKVIVAISKH